MGRLFSQFHNGFGALGALVLHIVGLVEDKHVELSQISAVREVVGDDDRGVGFTNGGGQGKMGVVLPGKKERIRKASKK